MIIHLNVFSEVFDTQERIKNALFYDDIRVGLRDAIRACGDKFRLAEVEGAKFKGTYILFSFFYAFSFICFYSWTCYNVFYIQDVPVNYRLKLRATTLNSLNTI